MPRIAASASATIPAPAPLVYGIIADYRDGHPRILPPEFFASLTVERGGRGAGTRIAFEMKAFGRVTTAHAEVTEPQPGRELVETTATGIVTTFRVDPLGATATRVAIETVYRAAGLRGWIELLLSPPYLRKVYAAELKLLAAESARRHA